jgi:hypothetical protein
MHTSSSLHAIINQFGYAIEGHELGFYFEEGGCWGFALALSQFFDNAQQLHTLQVMTHSVHVGVKIQHQFIDHQGASICPDCRTVDEKTLIQLALLNGTDVQTLDQDRLLALDVIETARELAEETTTSHV